MSFANEDWERVHLTDRMYLLEKEWEEQEHFMSEDKPPAKLTLKIEGMEALSDTISKTIKEKYQGNLDCEEQRADLYAYVEGKETPIKAITETCVIYDTGKKIALVDSDVATLAYIQQVI